MADLIAIGYPDETTAFAAADEARRLAADLIIQPGVRLLHRHGGVPSVRRAVAVPTRSAIQSARAPTEALPSIPAWGPVLAE